MPLLHCPKCCPKRWETVHRVAGSCGHSWDAADWLEVPGETIVVQGVEVPRIASVGPWGWRCDNCGHFKRPRPLDSRRQAIRSNQPTTKETNDATRTTGL